MLFRSPLCLYSISCLSTSPSPLCLYSISCLSTSPSPLCLYSISCPSTASHTCHTHLSLKPTSTHTCILNYLDIHTHAHTCLFTFLYIYIHTYIHVHAHPSHLLTTLCALHTVLTSLHVIHTILTSLHGPHTVLTSLHLPHTVLTCLHVSQGFQDIEGMRRAFESTKKILVDVKQTYVKRRDTMRQQVTSFSLSSSLHSLFALFLCFSLAQRLLIQKITVTDTEVNQFPCSLLFHANHLA